jgi:hypothetical protein
VAEGQPLPARSQIVQQHLADAGLTVTVTELPDSTRTAGDAAAALGCEIGAIASSLVFLADGKPLPANPTDACWPPSSRLRPPPSRRPLLRPETVPRSSLIA